MSRLQAGGLALVIHDKFEVNIGVVVKLIEFKGYQESFDGGHYTDGWVVEGVNSPLKAKHFKTGFVANISRAVTSAKNLMPLGDKQTQDELAEELEEV